MRSPSLRAITGKLRRSERPIGVMPRQSGVTRPELTIVRQGRSSRFHLDAGRLTVGGSADCDAVIIGAEPRPAFTVERDQHGQGFQMEALREGCILDGKTLTPHDLVAWKSGVLCFDDIECRLSGLADSQDLARTPDRRKWLAGGLFLVAAILLAVGALPDGNKPAHPAIMAMTPLRESIPASAIASELRQTIRMARLPDGLTVEETAQEIRVSQPQGALRLQDKTKLADIIKSLSRRSPLPIIDKTTMTSDLSGFIAAAALQPQRFVIGTDGKRYREGDLLPGGWRLDSIEGNGVSVSRDGTSERVQTQRPMQQASLSMGATAMMRGSLPR
ncbi:SctD/MshK family protein [Allorhizobium undicola]|uniref:SctD/MshK family protein n=1 Tax=Allorhizobium undicola TaxID=78527 RepID=UPI000AE1B43A|nr:hypothetical protein [Allorhizobium undicola]